MGLLADIYSGSDSLKRKVKGLLADPLGTIEQKINQFGEDQQAAINNAQDATGFGGNRSVLLSPQQKQQASKALGDYAGSMGLAGLTVWHGSPHKFDKFDSGKIGTGEGAQAYGHGLYLAESPDVARSYAGANNVHPASIAKLKEIVSSPDFRAPSDVKWASDELARLESLGSNHYKVDLPDEHIAKMLDWDKPLSQQAPDVQAAIGPMFGPNSASLTGQDIYKKASSFDSMANVASVAGDGAESQLRRVFPSATDKEIAQAIVKAKSAGSNQRIAAQMLKDAGIPGIRYLDGGSRGAGSGSSNFVVFPGNEGLLNILERNGQPMNGLLAK